MSRDLRLRSLNRAEVVFVEPPQRFYFAETYVLVRLSVSGDTQFFVLKQRHNGAYSAKKIADAEPEKP
jgi:hypothetical protein